MYSRGPTDGFAVLLAANTETTYDWANERRTVPLQVGASQVFTLGRQPISIGLNGRYWAERPTTAPE